MARRRRTRRKPATEGGGGKLKRLAVKDVRFLAMEGGGGKGVAYLGAVDALHGLDLYHEDPAGRFSRHRAKKPAILGFAGSSAGAITATLLSIGISRAELLKALGSPLFKEGRISRADGPKYVLGPPGKPTTSGEKWRRFTTDNLDRISHRPSRDDVVRDWSLVSGHYRLDYALGFSQTVSAVAKRIRRGKWIDPLWKNRKPIAGAINHLIEAGRLGTKGVVLDFETAKYQWIRRMIYGRERRNSDRLGETVNLYGAHRRKKKKPLTVRTEAGLLMPAATAATVAMDVWRRMDAPDALAAYDAHKVGSKAPTTTTSVRAKLDEAFLGFGLLPTFESRSFHRNQNPLLHLLANYGLSHGAALVHWLNEKMRARAKHLIGVWSKREKALRKKRSWRAREECRHLRARLKRIQEAYVASVKGTSKVTGSTKGNARTIGGVKKLPVPSVIDFQYHDAVFGDSGVLAGCLRLTASNLSSSRIAVFGADTTPRFPVAYAARISGGFPGVFQPVELTSKWKKYLPSEEWYGFWVDGGVFNNAPIRAFEETFSFEGLRKTLLLRLDLPGRTEITGLPTYLAALLGALTLKSSESHIAHGSFLAHQSIDLDTTGLSTLEFVPPTGAKLKKIRDRSATAVNKYFKRQVIVFEKPHVITAKRRRRRR